ncbi:winged helix-turn-helix transcriptional regulator [Microbacterium rhizomatis]|uniref:Helix-turn-helix transcriptional regulator n=1 Tax=Microbacterium rhizomatis TaxID=1631477 RepID=A0A5J5J9I4_9MICO|nr:helix-turn-helix domain-containing protein [Microbacterium rhizomatis]KAA9111463.1 helix-turn-helix transcriptional regulator [Microbacterium rhizomatis]
MTPRDPAGPDGDLGGVDHERAVSRHADPEPRCQIVRTLDIVGEKWSLLVIRDALRGVTRFSDFRASLGAPSDILSARLARLVDAGILEKRMYREVGQRERPSYHLTEAGRGLQLVIASMVQWNDRFDPAPAGAASVVVDPVEGAPLALAFVDLDGRVVDPDEVAIVPGPGALSTW